MTGPANDDDPPDGEEPEESFELEPSLLAVGNFARLVRQVPWFATVGEPLDPADVDAASAYLDALDRKSVV